MAKQLERKVTKRWQSKTYGLFEKAIVDGKPYEQLLNWSPIIYNDRAYAQKMLDGYMEWREKHYDVKYIKMNCEHNLYKTVEIPKYITTEMLVTDELTTTLHESYERCYYVKELVVMGEKSTPQIVQESFEHVLSFINSQYDERAHNGESESLMRYSDEVNGALFFVPPGKQWKVVKK